MEGNYMAEVRLMNMGNIFTAYGMPGHFVRGHSAIRSIDVKTQLTIGKIEGAINIDTPEEFITAAYYSPIQISSKAQTAINRELPQNKEGALRLGSMWMRKIAENPENKANYYKAIDIICQKSNVTRAEINSHYAVSIEQEIFNTGKRHLGGLYSNEELRNGTLRPIINYYLDPTEANLKMIAVVADQSRNTEKYVDAVRTLSPDLSAKVTSALLRL